MTATLSLLSLGLFASCLLPALGCGVFADGEADGGHRPMPVDLVGSLDPLQAWFDAHTEQPRALLILSPV